MYKKTELSNGLRVVTHDMDERDSTSVGLWVGAGGRYEADRVKGAAHFLEHILFKGSRKYSCDQIKEEIEGVGGTLNAFTSEEHTCYYAKIPSKYLNKTFDILADMVFAPLIASKDVEKEKGVIIEEIKMYHDLPQYFVLEQLDKILWPDHPLGKNLAGSIETVSRMTNKDLRQFHSGHYATGNIVVSASGNVNHSKFVAMVKRKLGRIASHNKPSFEPVTYKQATPKLSLQKKDIEQMHLALGMPSYPDDHKDKYVLALLHVVLGGNMSSRLFDEVREKRGLAYSISSSVKALRDTGVFMIRAGVDNHKVVQAVEVVIKELEKIKKKPVTKGEFTRAKDYYSGQVLLALEDTMDHMLWIGESTINRNRMMTLKDVIKLIKKVTIDDIMRVANDIFAQNRFNLSLVGPMTAGQERELFSLMGVKAQN